MSQSGNPDRLHALDAVRAFALLLGVVHHATISFIWGTQDAMASPVQDVSSSVLPGVVAYTGHMFRMSLFFVMAGFFARLVAHRRGLSGFCSDRLKRIGIPLVVGWIVLFPIVNAVWSYGATGSFWNSPLLDWPPAFDRFPISYLWFLYYLLCIYAIALVLRGAVLHLDTGGKLPRAADRLVLLFGEYRWLGPALLMIPFAMGLLTRPASDMLGGIPTPNGSLVPGALPLIEYGIAFGLGWVVHRNIDALLQWGQRWRGYFIAAMVTTVACIALSQIYPENDAGTVAQLERVAYAMGYGFAAWCWIFAVTGFALRFLSTPSPARRYVADASYWIYLVHYPIVLALQIAVADVNLHWSIKFPFVVAVTLAISFITYHYFVRYTFIGEILNGRRFARPGAQSPRRFPWARAL